LPEPEPGPARVRAAEPAVAPPELGVDQLAAVFGLPDLGNRLEAVDAKIADVLGRGGALLGPASTRVASTGGKRLRPLFTIVAAAIGDVFDDNVVSAAAAVELVQVGSLVHDDILDEADTRRGKPTINAVEGVNHAVLAGDYILARAAELAASVSREAAALLAETLGDLCEGQVLELRDVFDPDRTVDAHLASVRGKTAALFSCACRLGAQCGGLPERNQVALARFGEAFGMGFQVLDDVLDLIGDADRLGKPTGNDVASGVYTLPVLAALHGADGRDLRRLLTGPLGGAAPGPHRPVEVERALQLVRGSGSVPTALEVMDRYADDARRAVAHLDQTTIGGALASFPRTYSTWALETFMDERFLEVPLTAMG
jgi:geranylgeranyl pyrophosphate synthase